MIDIRCGTWERKLSDVSDVDLIFTSPPYNIGSRCPRKDGRRKHGEYDPKSYGGITGYADSLPENEYQDKQIEFLTWCASVMADDGILVYNHKPRRAKGMMIHPMAWIARCPELLLMEEVIWDRGSTHNHCNRLLWPTTERLYVLRKESGKYRFFNRKGLRFRSDVWRIPLSNRPADGHAAPFQVELAEAVVDSFSRKGDLVCDPYSGSGTTALACKNLGRRFVGTEQDRTYHKNSVKRLKGD